MSSNISLQQTIQRNESFIEAPIDNDIVLMSIENGKYYGLDAVASRVWTLLEQPISLQEVIDTLMQEYDVEREQCEAEMWVFIEHLFDENALVV